MSPVRCRVVVAVLTALLLGVIAPPAQAAVSPFWQELGGSASGQGVSGAVGPATAHEGSVAVGTDGLPVVAYTEYPDAVSAQGTIMVKRWTGSAWASLSPGGIGQGYAPKVRVAAGGAIHVAWLRDDLGGNTEVRLRVRTTTTFDELGGSDSDGGISGSNPGITAPFSLALTPAGNPVVAFLGFVQNGVTQVTTTPALIDGTQQVYVRRWTGSAWEFVGPDFTGGGASNALSFETPTGTILHDADAPSLATDASGNPVVAFTYFTTVNQATAANTDVYVTRWNGVDAWVPVGPAVPAGDTPEGNGGPGGVSHSNTGSYAPSLAAGATGFALAWEEDSPTGATYVWVRVWNGAAWVQLAGSATGSGFALPETLNVAPRIALDQDRPVVAWQLRDLAAASQIFVLRWNGTAWVELGLDSAANAGISDALLDAVMPSLALTPTGGSAPTGVPTVAWIDAGAGQLFLRQYYSGPLVALTVRVLGNGVVTSDPPGVQCAGGVCVTDLPAGTQLTLLADPAPFRTFSGWAGACTGSGSCIVTLSGPAAVDAGFSGAVRLTVSVNTPAGTTGQGVVGTISGPAGECGFEGAGACEADLPAGTRVILRAVAEPGNRFLNWSGGPCHGRTNSTCGEFTLNANVSTVALFRGTTSVAVLKAGNGTGTVSGTGFACGLDCSDEVPTGTARTLTATPATGSRFQGWSGDACHGQPSRACAFTASGLNQSITATFTLNRHALAIVNRPSGRVINLPPLPGGTLDCGAGNAVCAGVFDFGTPVVLQATPSSGFVFVNWTGVTCAGGAANATCAFPLRANVTATPNFRARTVVTVVKPGNGAGTVSGPGISCGGDCSAPEFDGKLVKLTAVAAVGSRFLGFDGACVSNTSSCSFVPAGNNQTVNANFQLVPYTITVASRPSGRVADVNGIPDPVLCGNGATDCASTLDFGTRVVLQATPIAGARFVNWTGVTCLRGAANATCEFVVRAANVSLAPNYRNVSTVSLNKSGMGTVTSSPAGIACGTTCQSATFDFARDTRVRLTAAPATGWNFNGFTGDCTGTACLFNASAPTALVAASFSIQSRRLGVTVVGNGSVSSTGFLCDPSTTPCAQDFGYGTTLPLVPVAAPGYRFTGWTQDCTGANPTTCRPVLTANRTVTATFRPIFGLAVSKTGNSNSGVITSSPAGIRCGVGTATDCDETYLGGTVVTLTRSAPITGTVFRWLGDCAFRGASSTCPLTMSANHTVAGEYQLQPLGLVVNVVGSAFGTVSGLGGGINCGGDCLEAVDYGTAVSLLATPRPSPASEFVSWTGCTSVSSTSCLFTMTANRTVTATFRPLATGVTLQTPSSSPLGVGGLRQLTARASFTDGSQADVTAQTTTTTWTSSATAVATVNATGLVTGRAIGSTSIQARFRRGAQELVSAPIVVVVDRLAADTPTTRAITVQCRPYGDTSNDPARLACLPSGRNFEVHCRAFGDFATGGAGLDITDQVTWVSTNTALARPTGLVAFVPPVSQSFRIVGNGTAALSARLGGQSSNSSTTGTLGIAPWVVQGTTQTLTDLDIVPASPSVQAGGQVQLQAVASLTGAPGTACATPPPRDFSILVDWGSDDELVAEVSFFGQATGISAGTANISATYGIMLPVTVPLVVNP